MSWRLTALDGGRLVMEVALVAIVGMGAGVPTAQASSCTRQCRTAGQACRLPFFVAFQAQRAACSGQGRRLCIAAARTMYAAGRQLCRSVVLSCRRGCGRNGAPGDLQCGDGIVAPTEDCDPPGWASCTAGAACGADCRCP
jgi:hypothetical protein